MVKVRDARPDDLDGILALHRASFPTEAEAGLVDKLTLAGDALISLVAADEDHIIGHALFSRMDAEGDDEVLAAMALAPLAVDPDFRNLGLGTAMVHTGLRVAENRGADLVFVLGDLAYYRRFGFDTKTAAPFESPYAGPQWLAIALRPGFRSPAKGTATHAPAFAALR